MSWSFLWLFVLSVPMWWFFEYANSIVNNWYYILAHPISTFHYNLQASVDFSTVIPAVLSTVFLFKQFFEKHYRTLEWRSLSLPHDFVVLVRGVVLFFSLYIRPNELFPLVWVAPSLVVDSLNRLSGFPAVFDWFKRGEWLIPLSIMTATLFTGFFWEMWNFYSLPKWMYTIPYVGFWKIFEMPFLGYFGYPFFGLIIVSYTLFVSSLFRLHVKEKLF